MAKRRPTPDQIRRTLIEAGDIQGLLRHFAEAGPGMFAGSDLSRCVRSLKDVDQSIDVGFAMVVETTLNLLARTQLALVLALDRHDHGPDPAGSIPECLKPTLVRFENIARFLSEMSQARQRVRHLQGLDAEKKVKGHASSRISAGRNGSCGSNGHSHQNGTAKRDGLLEIGRCNRL